MLRGVPYRPGGRGKRLTELREFQDGELIAGTRYRVIRLIGVGGMGSVYEVEHVELGKRFVLKALLRELARREDLAQRLRNEWRALARLQHENIVNVTDAGTSSGGVPYYVMERLDGDTLAALLRQKRRLHVLDAVNIAAAVLDALSAAHDIGIIHRDVKPANVFIASGGGVKLLDFGIAKIADATSVVTARGLAVGTPRYMSPEQARGERVDGRSDVYAAALILFEMIAGVGPFDDARDANELLLAHLAREAPALSSLVIGVSPELERILASMLAKDCRKRPAHAREGAQYLRGFAARQRALPATDALTVRAEYGAGTLAAAQRSTPSPLHDSPTRPEGAARNAANADVSASDLALTQRLARRSETTQVTVSANTHGAFSVSSAPNTTFVSPPSFDGSTTLEMSAIAPAAPSRGPAPSSSGVERPERTEILAELPPPQPFDAPATRTQVPVPERARPVSLTPPPVVGSGRSESAPIARSTRMAALVVAAAGVLAALGFLARRPGAPPVPSVAFAQPIAAAPLAPTAPAAIPEPLAPASVASAPAVSAVPAANSAALEPQAAPSAAANIRMIPNTKRLSVASLAGRALVTGPSAGPFLRALPANRPSGPSAPPRVEPALPGSGL